MINRIKLEHILEYARQQRHIGQHCKIPPGDMVEIMEIAMRKAGNSPVTPDGWISCSERMPDDGQHVIILCDGAFVLYAQYRDGEFFDVVRHVRIYLARQINKTPFRVGVDTGGELIERDI